MKHRLIFLLFLISLEACLSKKTSTVEWINSQIESYLNESSNPVTTLYVKGETSQEWDQIENTIIDNKECVQYELRLPSIGDKENLSHIIATTFIAMDTNGMHVYETELETGEYIQYK